MQKSIFTIKSTILANNPLGDKVERKVILLSPDKPKNNSPLLLGLSGFASDPDSLFATSPLGDSLETIVQRLYEKELIAGSHIALIDGFTKLGGNFYINSTATGNYEDFIVKEVLPELRIKVNYSSAGIFGKGSGGFGAFNLALHNPGTFRGFASHSMDAGFEYLFLPEFSTAMEEFRSSSGPTRWLDKYWSGQNRIASRRLKVLQILCASAFLSPNKEAKELGTDFPFDWNTGEFFNDVWKKWTLFDPARSVKNYLRQLENMRCVFMDVGTRDEFSAMWGSRSIDAQLSEAKIKHTYEEYDDGHFGINYRFEKSLAALAQAIV